MKHSQIIKQVSEYYSSKILDFGATPQGVDWNSEESQRIRFEQLVKIIPEGASNFSVLDYGCGYGALYEYLRTKFTSFDYTGYDISEAMLAEAKKKYPGKNIRWISSADNIPPHDFVMASGILNVKLNFTKPLWEKYIKAVLQQMNSWCRKGFAFNILTKYSDREHMKKHLYYADPAFLFDYCKKNFSKYVAVLHDYPLYEFTIHVKKF
jgi:SAM-dependent methyltransferase